MITSADKNHGQKSDREHAKQAGIAPDIRLHSGRGRHFLRIVVVTVGVVLAGMAMGGVGLYFLFQGGSIENEALNNRIERSITAFLGHRYDVRLGPTKVEFRGTSLISITSSDVKVLRVSDGRAIAEIGKVIVGVPPMSLLNGNPKINSVTLVSSKLDIQQLLPAKTGAFPANLDATLKQVGENLAQLQARLASGEIQTIAIRDSVLSGYKPGRRSSGEFVINELKLTTGNFNELKMKLDASTGFSTLSASASYSSGKNGGRMLSMNFDGVDVREWIVDPQDPEFAEKFLASNSTAKGRLVLEFNDDNSAQQPILNLIVGEGNLRLGRKGFTKINQLALNFRLFPKLNRVVLERSKISIGGFQAILFGALTPDNPEQGLAGDIDYSLVVEKAVGPASQAGEKIFPASVIIEGGFERARSLLNIDQWNLSVGDGSIVGSASLGFDSETPSLVMNGVSNGLPVEAVKQFWPVFLAKPVRNWVRERVYGGKIMSATISASIPGGILGRLHRGKRIGDDELVLDVEIEDASFDTFGELPTIRGASGKVELRGMRTDVKLNKGLVYVEGSDPISVKNGSFTIADAAIRPLVAKTTLVASGPIAGLASIANEKPLGVMNRLNMVATQWSGRGEIDLVASFPLKKKPKYQNIKWQAQVRLRKVKSSRPVNGRIISQADVVIDVSPDKAVITGNSVIDGISGNVLLIEPIGKDSKTKRRRVLKSRMNAKDRSKLGLELAPVITGIVEVEMEQNEGRKTADITVDLKDAEIALPWIGWRKGKGVAAKASFQMNNVKKLAKITNLKLSGQGFSLVGDLEFDQNGIRSADFPKASLNAGDDLSVRIRRNKGEYTITTNGRYFDGRVLVNKLFKQDGIGDEQGSATFRLFANIDRVKGFGKRLANNLVLQYSVKNGWLDALSFNTQFGRNRTTKIDANTSGNTTSFRIRSQDAGNALSFLDLYTRMDGGVMAANLQRRRREPFRGDVLIENFVIVDEPKLKKLVSNEQLEEFDRGGRIKKEFKKIQTNRVRFPSAQASIEKGQGYLTLEGSLTGVQIGMTYNGTLFDKNNRVNLAGTFMPAFGISRIVSAIPFVGQILSNGRDSGLIGITYRLRGPVDSPDLVLNPLSIVAPGIFKKVFEPRAN